MNTLWFFTALVFPVLFEESHQCKSTTTTTTTTMMSTTTATTTPNILRILVVTGAGDSRKKTQLWPKPDSQCALPDFPWGGTGAVGFWTAQGPTVCGGFARKNCLIYKAKEHQWMPWTNMGTYRQYASALQINPNQALIIGGFNEKLEYLKSTEVISSSGSEKGNDFPVRISEHCSFIINSTHAMVTGGIDRRGIFSGTWFVDLATTTFTPGPPMNEARNGHGCSIFRHGTKSFGLVVGGFPVYGSTEMIDLDQESPTWTEGPKLPRELGYLTLVTNTQGTYAIGGSDGDRSNEVLQLDCPEDQTIQSCQWKKAGNLQFPRMKHVSISIPESYDICN